MMIADHTKLLDDMKSFDAEAGITIPQHNILPPQMQ